jgi:hypothetical protein
VLFRGQILLNTILIRGGGACTTWALDGEEGTAGSSGEAGVGAGDGQPGSNARKGRSLAVDKPYASRNLGVRRDMAQAGGRSQAEERLREAAAILRISRRRKPCTEVFLDTKLMSVPGVELVGEHHQGGVLTSEPLRRQVTSPGGRSKLGRQGG